MLQFYTVEDNGYGSWNTGPIGQRPDQQRDNNTISRYPMGSLPASNQWVRLEVPASAVGLEGRIIEGMAFTLYSGRAAWTARASWCPICLGTAGLTRRRMGCRMVGDGEFRKP